VCSGRARSIDARFFSRSRGGSGVGVRRRDLRSPFSAFCRGRPFGWGTRYLFEAWPSASVASPGGGTFQPKELPAEDPDRRPVIHFVPFHAWFTDCGAPFFAERSCRPESTSSHCSSPSLSSAPKQCAPRIQPQSAFPLLQSPPGRWVGRDKTCRGREPQCPSRSAKSRECPRSSGPRFAWGKPSGASPVVLAPLGLGPAAASIQSSHLRIAFNSSNVFFCSYKKVHQSKILMQRT